MALQQEISTNTIGTWGEAPNIFTIKNAFELRLLKRRFHKEVHAVPVLIPLKVNEVQVETVTSSISYHCATYYLPLFVSKIFKS